MNKKMSKAEMVGVFERLEKEQLDNCTGYNEREVLETIKQALEHVPDDQPKEDGLYLVEVEKEDLKIIIYKGDPYWFDCQDEVDYDETDNIEWGKQLFKPVDD